MMTTSEIIRTPIKLRESVHIDMCGCWGSRRVHINGELQYIIGDDFSYDRLKEFLEKTEYCVNVRFTEDINKCWDKIELCLAHKVPVTVRTPRVVGENQLQQMFEVLHCSVQTDIELPSKVSGNSLESTFWRESTVQPLREMLIRCKAQRMDTAAVFNFNMLDNSLFDLYEMLDYLRSGIGHMFLVFPDLGREVYNTYSSIQEFYYYDEVTTRWIAKDKYVKYIAKEVNDFSSSKKIQMELVGKSDYGVGTNINRYTSSGYSKLPTGMPQFIYKKSHNGMFSESEYPQNGGVCPNCGEYVLLPTLPFDIK